MRLKSSIFVSALVRRLHSQGGFATVLNKGAEEAGAIFVVLLKPAGKADLYGPAPQAVFSDDGLSERLFEQLLADADPISIDEMLEKQKRFDPDCWIVELEFSGEVDFLSIAGANGG